MELRQIIFQAADWIESNPEKFRFGATQITDCGSPHCALGWIGVFSKKKFSLYGLEEVAEHIRAPYCARWGVAPYQMGFYEEMDNLAGKDWTGNPKVCAEGLRRFANKYHPAEPSRELKSGSEIVKDFLRKPMREIA